MARLRWIVIAIGILGLGSAVRGQSEHGFVNTRPSGQPYLSPEESVRRMKVPPGWEVKVFAAEPDIINPIAFTVDERGRLWVVECYEYPKRTPPGRQPRDRIKILEDTTGQGKADKVTLWAEGKDLPHFDMASGIEVGRGNVYLGAAPYLLRLGIDPQTGGLKDQEILLRGFGSQDSHEVLNTFQWGPDGKLYGLHGIFTQSEIGGVQMDAAVWRFDASTRQFGIFAEGTSNPWGLDFDPHGQAFLACCVIPHCFHMIPGGTYIRQAGASKNPYAFGLLHEISDHLHHQESGWAHAGALVLQGDHIPADYQGSLLMGSIHGCSIKRDLLARRGSTFVARHGPDFLVSGDKNFRPINLRWGPDGSIYVIDWHDQNPCHQAAPDSWDLTHGRIYKIQRTGAKPVAPEDLGSKSSAELVRQLSNNNPWSYRTSLRLLSERRDASVALELERLLFEGQPDTHCLRGLWGLWAVGVFDEVIARRTLEHPSPWVRAWTVRLLGEAGKWSPEMLGRLEQLALHDPAPEVRSQMASTAQTIKGADALPVLHALMAHAEDAHDPCLPLMIWLAYEPHVAADRTTTLDWLRAHAPGNALILDEILPRATRRLGVSGKADDLAAVVAFLGSANDSRIRVRALEGLLLALENRQADGPQGWASVHARLRSDPDPEVHRLTRRLAVKFHDPEAVARSLAVVSDRGRLSSERIAAIRDLESVHPKEALQPLAAILSQEASPDLQAEVCRALADYNAPEIAPTVLARWDQLAPTVRSEALNLLAGRKAWAGALLAAVAAQKVSRADLSNNTVLRIRALKDPELDRQIERVWGRVRTQSPAELDALIARMRDAIGQGRGSFERGRKVFETQCSKCHRFEGKGHDVGPNLDGAARDIEYLLVNVLDPNRVVGQPYYTRYVTLKNGRVETGLLAAEDNQSVTLKGENDALKVIQRTDIEEIAVQEKSLMPEGLANNMTVQDFRDLIRFVMANPFVTDVAVAGPYPAITVPGIDVADPLHSKHVSWVTPTIPVTGRIPLPPVSGYGDQVTFVTGEVIAPSRLRTHLQLGSADQVEVWLNGKSIYRGKPGKEVAPDLADLEVELREGANRLLLKATYRGSRQAVYLRLADPQRKLIFSEKN